MDDKDWNGLSDVGLSTVGSFKKEERLVVGGYVGGVVCEAGSSFVFPLRDTLALEEGLVDCGVF